MTTHNLKTDPWMFQAVAIGNKPYEIRRDDRGFEVGDTLILRETRFTRAVMDRGAPLEYTGVTLTREVTHVLRGPLYGLEDGWVILTIRHPEREDPYVRLREAKKLEELLDKSKFPGVAGWPDATDEIRKEVYRLRLVAHNHLPEKIND